MSGLYEWVDLDTGEVVEEGTHGAVAVPTVPAEAVEDAQALGDWYTRELVSLEAREEAAKLSYERTKRHLAAERRALERSLPQIEAATLELLTGKKKSVDFAYGRASFRVSTKMVVSDEGEALEWARVFCPEAVTVKESLSKTRLTEDCPFVSKETANTFSVKGAK